MIKRTHPAGVALREIIVNGHHVNTFALHRIQNARQSRHQSFTFTSFHFGNFSFVKNHTADQLNVKMTHFKRSNRCFANNRKNFWQDFIQSFFFFLNFFLKFFERFFELFVAHFFEFFAQSINFGNFFLEPFQNLFLRISKNLSQKLFSFVFFDHHILFLRSFFRHFPLQLKNSLKSIPILA